MGELLPVERLTGPRDLFRCAPYAATISALTCLSRRAAKYEGGRMTGHAPTLADLAAQSTEPAGKPKKKPAAKGRPG